MSPACKAGARPFELRARIYLEPTGRIELPSPDYETGALPLCYAGVERTGRIELP